MNNFKSIDLILLTRTLASKLDQETKNLFEEKISEHQEAIEWILKYGEYSLFYAVHYNNPRMIELLIRETPIYRYKNYIPEDTQSEFGFQSALFYATTLNYVKCAKTLLQNGANPNIEYDLDEPGITPLMEACDRGYYEMVEVLLDGINGRANPNVRDKFGLTPLMVACQCRNPKIVELLLSKGADPSLTDSAGRTVFSMVIDNETYEILQRNNSK